METNKCTKQIEIKIEGQEWQEAIDKAFQKANAKAKIDGFRPGKAPKDVFMKKYGEQSLWMDAADIVINDAYHRVMEENRDLELVAQPDIELKEINGDYVEFVFVLTSKPEVKVKQYKNLGVTKEDTNVTDEEIEAAIEEMRKRYAENVIKEGPIADGDIAIIDFEGFKDDQPFEGGKAENYSLTIGSHAFIPGFEEQLIGLKAGEEKELSVTFPEDYHSEELKGQPVVFKVKVNDVKQVQVPEINNEFFEDLGMEGIDNLESLQKEVKLNLEATKNRNAENKYLDDLLEAAAQNTEVEIPEVMIKEEQNRMMKQLEENLKMQGLTLPIFFQYTNSSEEKMREEMKEEATKRVTFRLMLEEIAHLEKIEIAEEEALKEAEELAHKYEMEKEEFLKSFGGLDMVKYDIQMRKAIDILKGE